MLQDFLLLVLSWRQQPQHSQFQWWQTEGQAVKEMDEITNYSINVNRQNNIINLKYIFFQIMQRAQLTFQKKHNFS